MRERRYRVVSPVSGGYAWWDVIDTQSSIMPNFAVASFSLELHQSQYEAGLLCDRLNQNNNLSFGWWVAIVAAAIALVGYWIYGLLK